MKRVLEKLAALRAGFSKFTVPIKGDDLPALRLHLAQGTPLSVVVAAVSMSVTCLALIAAGRVVVWRELVIIGTALLALWPLAKRVRSPEVLRHPERELFAVLSVMVLALCVEGWATVDGFSDDLEYAFAFPLALAAFAPWAPRYTLVFGALTLAATFVVNATGISRLTVPFWKTSEILTIGVGVGAVASQMQRHLWRTLEGSRRQMAALDRVAGLGRLTASLAHEVKTPIAATMNSLDTVRQLLDEFDKSIGHPEVTEDDLREIARELREAASRAAQTTARVGQIIRRVREHTSGMNATSSTEFGVLERAHAIQGLVAHLLQSSKGRLDLSGVSADAVVHGDIGKFDQILLNLVVNAIEAGLSIGKDASICIATFQEPRALLISVEDDGPGLTAESEARLFQPMYTTKATGTGLGLAISRELAEGAFGGSLVHVPSPRGARFELRCGTAAAAQSQEAFAPAG